MTETLSAGQTSARGRSTYRTKLIEVALPLEAINAASAREKSIRHGHLSTLHPWWSRKPLATCRAVLFAQLVDDPSSLPDEFPTEEAQEQERQRLFGIIQALVQWENSNNQTVLEATRREIARSIARATGVPLPRTADEARLILAAHAPPQLDPFCGGGSIPLEAQRLGLEAHASDLNPVAVLVSKALIEIPPKFAGQPPVNPEARARMGAGSGWTGARGLAEDVLYYGKWMRDEAHKRIGHLYPKAKLPKELGGGDATVIAWLWARTVTCPNPACRAQMPLASKWWLSTKAGGKAWVEPVVDHAARTVSFEVRTGQGAPPDGTRQRGKSICIFCGNSITDAILRDQAKHHGLDRQLLAIVADGPKGRVYLSPSQGDGSFLEAPETLWLEQQLPDNARWFSPPSYGLATYRDLFTPRQLETMTVLSDLVGEARDRVRRDAMAASLPDNASPLNECGTGVMAYADAVAVMLGIIVSKASVFLNQLARWRAGENKSAPAFGRQAIPMVWDFAEVNPFAGAGGDFAGVVDGAVKTLASAPSYPGARVQQGDASTPISDPKRFLVSTDPPYYDNIGYADLSDFFYVWLRRSLSKVYPELFSTMLVPKAHELVATPYRFGGNRDKARRFFEEGLSRAFAHIWNAAHPDYPLTVYYAFKQAESDDNDRDDVGFDTEIVASTGWETMLEGLLRAGFAITGTWPMRTELTTRLVGRGTNALASSIVLVCRPRPESSGVAPRRVFIAALRRELPDALKRLQHGNVAPVDLAQASIGPGMAVFSRYAQVLEADGSAMSVRTALGIINAELDAYLAAQEGEMDAETRFCVAWFEQYGMRTAKFGEADVLARAKNTSIEALRRAGVLHAVSGDVRLLARTELDPDWDPRTDQRVTDWECAQHLILALDREGEDGAARLSRHMGAERAQIARDLAYRLYAICERKKWADEALAYNALVASWPAIQEKAATQQDQPEQGRLI